MYYFRVFSECSVDVFVKAKNKEDALRKMKKILRGDTSGIEYIYGGEDIGSHISVERMELHDDEGQHKLELDEKEWKILEKY